jgi:transposase
MGESMTIEGATDADAFEAYVEHFLAPTLKEGQVVVLDGLGAHRTQRVTELIEARGAQLLFLPSYSPDLNPIEEAFSKIKGIVRKVGARMREALVEAIERALSAVTPEDATAVNKTKREGRNASGVSGAGCSGDNECICVSVTAKSASAIWIASSGRWSSSESR